jgi:hypothetical protein
VSVLFIGFRNGKWTPGKNITAGTTILSNAARAIMINCIALRVVKIGEQVVD